MLFIPIWLTVVGLFIWGCYKYEDHVTRRGGYSEASMGGWIAGGFAALLGSIFLTPGVGILLHDYPPYEPAGHTTMIALNDSTAVQGRFGFFSGYIEEEFRYFFYYEKDNGSIEMGWVPARHADVFEDAEPGTGRVEYFKSKGHWELFGYVPGQDPETIYEIHVPKDTVIREYTMDLEK